MHYYNRNKRKEPKLQKIHITTLKRKNETESMPIYFGLSCDKNSDNEFKTIKMKHTVLSGRASTPISDTDFFLIVYDPKSKISDDFYRGIALQNGRLREEYLEDVSETVQQHHFIIEYIGNYVDDAKIKLF